MIFFNPPFQLRQAYCGVSRYWLIPFCYGCQFIEKIAIESESNIFHTDEYALVSNPMLC